MPKKRDLSLKPRQRKLLSRLLDPDSPNVSQAGRDAGYVNRQQANRDIKSPQMQHAFQLAMERAGIDDDSLAQKLFDLLGARNTTLYHGEPTEVGPDNRTQLEALKVATNMFGHQPPKQDPQPQAEQHLHLHLEKHGLGPDAIIALDSALRRALEPEPDIPETIPASPVTHP